MYQTDFTPDVRNPARGRRNWLRALLVGVVLFIIATAVMFLTGNPNLYPTVILIGNFLVPIVFVAFLYDHRHLSTLTTETVATSFCIGGVLGVLGASVLESLVLPLAANPNQGLSLGGGLIVGLIEEGSKLLVVMFLARRMRHTSEMDGLLLGGAVGMGFAALESTGYAFTIFLLSHGNVGASIVETMIRGLLAPFGHGVWTGILAISFSHHGLGAADLPLCLCITWFLGWSTPRGVLHHSARHSYLSDNHSAQCDRHCLARSCLQAGRVPTAARSDVAKSIGFPLFDGSFSGNRRNRVLSGPSIMRKRHENVMSVVMGGCRNHGPGPSPLPSAMNGAATPPLLK